MTEINAVPPTKVCRMFKSFPVWHEQEYDGTVPDSSRYPNKCKRHRIMYQKTVFLIVRSHAASERSDLYFYPTSVHRIDIWGLDTVYLPLWWFLAGFEQKALQPGIFLLFFFFILL